MDSTENVGVRRFARLGFWLGVLLVGALALAGCTQPGPSASASPTANPSPGAYSGDLNSVDSADAQFGQFEQWSADFQSTGDVDDSDFK
ncbi:hypothetical protein HYV43_03370 [Candidatus Micrarchaeota archaeon]|nr:hypothetical protein [Candidatus Micrarchaeota archaeon]